MFTFAQWLVEYAARGEGPSPEDEATILCQWDLDKYIYKFRQINFKIEIYTFYNIDKYILKWEIEATGLHNRWVSIQGLGKIQMSFL